MFEDSNRIRFERPVDQNGRRWWTRRFFDPFGLTPEGMGDLITKSAAGEKSIIYHYIDGIGEKFALRVEGRFYDGASIWFVERTLELMPGGNLDTLEDVYHLDEAARATAAKLVAARGYSRVAQ